MRSDQQKNTSVHSHTTNSNYRQFQFIFPVAVASLLLFGTARFVLDNLRNNLYLPWPSHHSKESRSTQWSPPIMDHDNNNHIDQDTCNLFEGKWVWDNVSHPIYKQESCPYLVMQVSCQKNGRPDSLYQNWRWQPKGCTPPRFNASKLLEILRNKRMMFVGDSLQRNMYESMICLVQSVIPDGKKSFRLIPHGKIFTSELTSLFHSPHVNSRIQSYFLKNRARREEFNATIEFYWAPYIVESNSDDAERHTVRKDHLINLSVAKHSKQWEGVDILVFQTYAWWIFQVSWNYQPLINVTNGSDEVPAYNVISAYRLAMETWASWVESHINPDFKKVFFVTMSPTHLWSWEWNPGSEGNCFNESYPIEGPHWGVGSNVDIMAIVKDVIGKLKVNVRLLNITQLSEFRKDGHSSVYGEYRGKLLTKEQRLHPTTYADCTHWCLPGVPDAWNEILYAILLQDYNKSS